MWVWVLVTMVVGKCIYIVWVWEGVLLCIFIVNIILLWYSVMQH